MLFSVTCFLRNWEESPAPILGSEKHLLSMLCGIYHVLIALLNGDGRASSLREIVLYGESGRPVPARRQKYGLLELNFFVSQSR